MKIGRLEIKTSRWPWQGYGWFPHKNGKGPKAMFNPNGARFGGGWRYKLGVEIGGATIMMNLLFGIVTIRIERK